MFTVSYTTDYDQVKTVKQLVNDLSRIRVLVGVPEEKAQRPAGENASDITNAQLVFIHTHGVRRLSMRRAMQQTMQTGATYKQAYAMYIHSYGSPLWQVPPRPIIEPALKAHNEELQKEIQKALNQQLTISGGKQQALRQFKKVAMMGQNFARGWFTDGRNGWAPNAPSTIARKGSNKPLIDTGEMRKSIIGIVAVSNK